MNKTFAYFLGLSLMVSSCLFTFQPENKTVVYTGVVVDSSSNVRIIMQGAVISSDGPIEDHGHCWVLSDSGIPIDSLATCNSNGSLAGPVEYQSVLFKLEPGQTYDVKGFATVNGQRVFGDLLRISTGGNDKAVLRIEQVTSTSNQAEITNALGDDIDIVSHGNIWRLNSNSLTKTPPTLTDIGINADSTDLGARFRSGSFVSNLTGLMANRTYIAVAYYIDIDGNVVYSPFTTFNTTQD